MYTVYSISLNGKTVLSKRNYKPREFNNVHAYAAGKYHHPAKALIKSIAITTPFPAETNGPLNNLIKSIPILFKSWKVSFNVRPNEINMGPILHMGVGGVSSKNFADPIPGIYFIGGTTRLRVEYDVGYDKVFDTNALAVNQWSNIAIQQAEDEGKFIFSISVNYETVFSMITTEPRLFYDVHLYSRSENQPSNYVQVEEITIVTPYERSPFSNDPDFQVQLKQATAKEIGNCPSKRCWQYNEETKTCSLRE